MAALGEGGREGSLVTHVPGMRLTGKSQVAVRYHGLQIIKIDF